MYDGNPGEIDFGSSKCEVQVGEGLSYQEWTARYTLYIHVIYDTRCSITLITPVVKYLLLIITITNCYYRI